MNKVALYLRKSRADEEAEKQGEGETLIKHKKALLKTAQQLNLSIVKIYEEIVSGEFIDFRPEMKSLLEQVKAGVYDAVLVMDVDRLGRGNMQEQGLILDTFRNSKTKIITPRKTYDLSNEFDEEYSEFEAFMARKELKIITRRLQGGRVRAVEEGNYIGTRPPYGYSIKYDNNGGRILAPDLEQAEVVRLIFELYTTKSMGSSKISRELNKLGYLSYTGKSWEPSAVINILKNAVYIGRVQWKKKEQKKSKIAGKQRDTRTRPVEEWIDAKGKHEAIVSEDTYNLAQDRLKSKYHSPYQIEDGKMKITTTLAGLIKCADCGATMVYRPYIKSLPHIRCNTQLCTNRSSRYEYVERELLRSLEEWLHDFKLEWNAESSRAEIDFNKIKIGSLSKLNRELKELQDQKNKLFDLLERGIYSEELFINRSANIEERITQAEYKILELKNEIEEDTKRRNIRNEIIPKVEHVIQTYKKARDNLIKNNILKSIMHHAVYKKERHQRNDQFSLFIKFKF